MYSRAGGQKECSSGVWEWILRAVRWWCFFSTPHGDDSQSPFADVVHIAAVVVFVLCRCLGQSQAGRCSLAMRNQPLVVWSHLWRHFITQFEAQKSTKNGSKQSPRRRPNQEGWMAWYSSGAGVAWRNTWSAPGLFNIKIINSCGCSRVVRALSWRRP